MQNRSTDKRCGPDASLVIMLCTLVVGVLIGTVAYSTLSAEQSDALSKVSVGFALSRAVSGASEIFLCSLAVSSFYNGVIYLLGTMAFGQLPVFIVLLFRGITVGTLMSQLFSDHSGSDLFCCVMLVIPGAVVSLYALALCAKDSVRLSSRMLTVTLSDSHCQGLLGTLKNNSVRFLAYEAVIAVSALIDCICSVCFARGI